jgi:hypothetical protein
LALDLIAGCRHLSDGELLHGRFRRRVRFCDVGGAEADLVIQAARILTG